MGYPKVENVIFFMMKFSSTQNTECVKISEETDWKQRFVAYEE